MQGHLAPVGLDADASEIIRRGLQDIGCLSEAGRLIWSENPKEKFKGRGTDFGYACSPVVVDGKDQQGILYDRAKLRAGNIIRGPAVVLEMDSTTVILPGHVGKVDGLGNILITPND
jgi:N-methylhydantoinase A/oxoprolinase/acetone carboxylase beta subunit